MDILLDKKVKIRKKHKCFGCGRIFEKGSEMWNQVNVYDGDIGSIYICLTCDQILPFIDTNMDGVWENGDVIESMNSDNFKGTPEEYLIMLQGEKI